jgi:predicted NBD/HSP70 family sugar kinase
VYEPITTFGREEHKLSVAASGDAPGLRSETVRRANLSAIMRGLHVDGPLSRSQLVARTGLTRSAIRGLIGELAAARLVSESRSPPLGSPGRPSPVVRPNPSQAVVLSLEVSVDSLAAAWVGLGGAVLNEVRVDRPRGHLSPSAIARDLLKISRLRARRKSEMPIGVGVAMVGVVRRADGFVSVAPNLGWRDVPFGQVLAAKLPLDMPLSLANEADLGALAELRRGAARGFEDVLFISGEVGVGGGIIVDGRPLTGMAGYAGEVGHVPVNPDGRICGCGSVGCWETEVGEGALLREAGVAPDGGREAVEDVLADVEAGSATALAAVEHLGRWLGIGLAGLVNVFNPQLVVLGGLFSRIHPWVAAMIEAELDRRALRAPRAAVRVVPASLGVEGPQRGAAALALEPVVYDPARWLPAREAVSAIAV